MTMERLYSLDQLEANLTGLGASPTGRGSVVMIVRRPQTGEREIVDHAELSVEDGLVGDNWRTREYELGSPDPDAQVTLMNSRVIQAITQDESRWALAGDQLFVDLDLSAENLPAGTQLAVGTAVLEVTAVPHTGCSQFGGHYGHAALRFVNDVKPLNRRGVNARVVQAGTIHKGDPITRC